LNHCDVVFQEHKNSKTRKKNIIIFLLDGDLQISLLQV